MDKPLCLECQVPQGCDERDSRCFYQIKPISPQKREYKSRWSRENYQRPEVRAKVIARAKEWRENNRERVREYQRAWYHRRKAEAIGG